MSPDLDSKSDAIDAIQTRTPLAFGEDAHNRFTQTLEHHGYVFSVAAGTETLLEVTHKDSAAALDTELYVFGPGKGDFFGNKAIAFDDDSGFARLSKTSVVLEEAGTYLAVLRPARNTSGHYRLTLDCTNQPCQTEPSAPTVEWPDAVTNVAMMEIEDRCDKQFNYSLFDLEIEEELAVDGTLIQTFYTASIALDASFPFDTFISLFVPAGGSPEIETMECPGFP